MAETAAFNSQDGKWIVSGPALGARALDDLRHAVRRHFDQLHGSPGDRDPQAHARTQHRHDGGELRLHCGRISDRLRNWPAGRRPVDRQAGHTHRLHVGDGSLESLRHGPRAGQHSDGVRLRALFPWTRRIRQLSRRDQDRGRVVSAERALTGYRHLQLRRKCWSDPGSGHRSLGDAALGLARGLPDHRPLQFVLDPVVVSALPQARPITTR